jgi:hypothetical protein
VSSLYVASDGRIYDDEQEEIRKDEAVAYFRLYSDIRLEGFRKTSRTSDRILGGLVDVRTEHLPNKNLDLSGDRNACNSVHLNNS